MFWTIVIATAAGVCQFVNAYLGWRMATHPIPPEDKNRRRKMMFYDGIFILAGALGVALVVVMAYRTPRDRAHFDIQPYPTIGRPSGNWASGPDPNHLAEFLVINLPLEFNFTYLNTGPGVAYNIGARRHVFIEPDLSPMSQSDALTSEPAEGSFVLAKGVSGWSTAQGSILSPEDYDNLVYGRRVVFVVGELTYSDDSGKHIRDFCSELAPPQRGGLMIWGYCDSFNSEY